MTILDPMDQGGPYTLTAKQGLENVTLRDIYFGDVWLCSGQSNMAMTVLQVRPIAWHDPASAGREQAGKHPTCSQPFLRSPMPARSLPPPLAIPTSVSSLRLRPALMWSWRTWSALTCPGPSQQLVRTPFLPQKAWKWVFPHFFLLQPDVSWTESLGHGNFTYFSAVCWLLGRYLYDALRYPVGLVEAAWGGTPIEAWSSPRALQACGLLEDMRR